MHDRPERFHCRVVLGRGDPAHRAHKPGFSESVAEQPAGVLTPAVGMQDRSRSGPALPTSHVERVDHEFCSDVISDRPAHDPSGPGVHYRAAVVPAISGAVLGDVGEPQPVRAVGMKLAFDQIIMGCSSRDMAPFAAVTHALKAVFGDCRGFG